MESNPQPSDINGLAGRFMWFIIFWNHAEMAAKQIAMLLLGESTIGMAVTAELGNRTLMDALQAASHDLALEDMGAIGPHLRHFAKGYSTLLGHRNFYVHGIYATRPHEVNADAILYTFDGKGRVRIFNRHLTQEDLDIAIAGIHSLIGYGAAIQRELGATGEGLERLLATYQASLEMPDWPLPVEKTALYLQGQEPLPPEPNRKRRPN